MADVILGRGFCECAAGREYLEFPSGGVAITRELGATGNPAGDDFSLTLQLSVPEAASEDEALIAMFAGNEEDAVPGSLRWEWIGDALAVTLYGATADDWRRVTFAGHRAEHGGEVAQLSLVRSSTTVMVYHGSDALTGMETTHGAAPAWNATINGQYLVIGGYAGELRALGLYNYALAAEDVAWIAANDGAPLDGAVQGGQQLLESGPYNSSYGPYAFTSVSGSLSSATGVYAAHSTNRLQFRGPVPPLGKKYRASADFAFAAEYLRIYITQNNASDQFAPIINLTSSPYITDAAGHFSADFTLSNPPPDASTLRLAFLVLNPTGDLTLSNVRVTPLGCVLHWPCDERSLTLTDTSGNGLDGTLDEADFVSQALRWRRESDQILRGGGDFGGPYEPGEIGFIGLGLDPFHFDVSVEMELRVVDGGEPTDAVVDGAIMRTTLGASSVTDFQITPVFYSPESSGAVEFESSDVEIATVDGFGYVTGRAPGQVTITATSWMGRVVSRELKIKTTQGATVVDHVGYEPGSVMADADAAVRSRIAGKTPATSKAIFSTQNHAWGIYVRNPACWAADLDLTCISPWNSADSNKRAGTLVTPRHIIFATHYKIPNGAVVRFVTMDNEVVERTLIAQGSLPVEAGYYPDFTIGLLHADVPDETIQPCPVLPDDFADYVPLESGSLIYRGLPALVLDQEEKALIHSWYYETPRTSGCMLSQWNSLFYDEANYEAWAEPIISGDSGNPAFVVIGGELVLLTTWTFGGGGSGTCARTQVSALNALIAAVDAKVDISTGYTLSQKSLSTYNNYA